MKGCTNYTEEATRWTQLTKGQGKRPLLFRAILVLLIAVGAGLALIVFWPDSSDEGFAVVSAGDASNSATAKGAGASEGAEEGASPGGTASASEGASTPSSSAGRPNDGNGGKDTPQATGTPIVIYLTGAILNPGVYELTQESRIYDAITLAGGLVEGSAINYINPAAPLKDGQHVHIPSVEEIESGEAARIVAGGAVGMGGASMGAAGPGAETGQAEQIVNLNTADSTQLETLPGVGMATAKRIIDYREKYGPFASVDELKNVSGIGEKKFAELADKVCV